MEAAGCNGWRCPQSAPPPRGSARLVPAGRIPAAAPAPRWSERAARLGPRLSEAPWVPARWRRSGRGLTDGVLRDRPWPSPLRGPTRGMPGCLDLGPLPGGGRGDEAAAFRCHRLAIEDWDQRSALELPCDQHRVPDGGADAVHRGLDQHAVEAEARGPRQVRRRLALAREPVRPVGVPPEVVEQRPVLQVGRALGRAERGEQGGAADRQQVLLVERLPRAACPRGASPAAAPPSRRCRRARR